MQRNIYQKILSDNGFLYKETFNKVFCGKPYEDISYENPAYKGRVSITRWPSGIYGDAIHYFMKPNGILTPNVCETARELDMNLKRHYTQQKHYNDF